MELSDEIIINAPKERVYAALNDPETLQQCIPGCEELIKHSDTDLEAKVVLKVGPVKATFKGVITMSDMVEAERLTIAGEGKGGAAGFAKGRATVTFQPNAEGGTVLSYDVDASVGGKLAQLGSRLIDGFAKKMADQFFVNLQAHFEGPAEETAKDRDGESGKGWLGRLTGRD